MDDQTAIQSIMDQQTRCWNAGDLNCFMEGYWHSDSLMFIGKTGITYGYDSTLANYRKRYPDRPRWVLSTLTYCRWNHCLMMLTLWWAAGRCSEASVI